MDSNDVYLIDTGHAGESQNTGCWLLAGPEPLLIDPGPEPCLRRVLDGVRRAGVEPAELRAVLLTHIHLDHAGATGKLLQLLPELEVYVHERGARHLVDPSRLVASATRLYGERMVPLWGEILPVPAQRVHPLGGGEELEFGDLRLEALYTPGHAVHHVAFFDRSEGIAYTGDVAGMKVWPGGFVIPPTPPPDIDIELWFDSISLLGELKPRALRVTHFGQVEAVREHLLALRKRLEHWSSVARALVEEGEADEQTDRFAEAVRLDLVASGGSDEDVTNYVDRSTFSARQQWLGLERYWQQVGPSEAAAVPGKDRTLRP